MDKNEKFGVIYKRFLNNTATRQELEQIFALLPEINEAEVKKEIIDALKKLDKADNSTETEERLKLVKKNLLEKITELPDERRVVRLSRPWYYAAVACLAVGLSIGIILKLNKPAPYTQDLLPGGNQAMLTINGREQINPAKLKTGVKNYYGNVLITKLKDGSISYSANTNDTAALKHINIITTPKGGQYRIRLSDSTVVLLNSASSLEFPIAFIGGKRSVILKGEAYFEVTKNKHKPFIVSTGGQNVEVLGTRFDITDFEEDGGPITTLLEGKVKVSSGIMSAMLKPGQQSRLQNNAFAINDIDADQYSAWKDGNFDFEDVPLSLIMHKLGRWYNFETDYSKIPERNFYIRISRNSKLSEVLRMMTVSSGIKFNIEGRRVDIVK